MSGLRDALVGNKKYPTRADLRGNASQTFESAGTERDARERPEFERNHRAVDCIIRPPRH
jgi:hypothetical protein